MPQTLSQRDYTLVMLAVWLQGCLTFFALEALTRGLIGWFQDDTSMSLATRVLVGLAPYLPNGFAAVASVVWTALVVWLLRPRPQREEAPKPSLALTLALHFGLTSVLVLMFIALGLPLLEMISRL